MLLISDVYDNLISLSVILSFLFIRRSLSFMLYPPQINGFGNNLSEYKGQEYMELETGKKLEISCSSMENIHWILPNNFLSSGYNSQEVCLFFIFQLFFKINCN